MEIIICHEPYLLIVWLPLQIPEAIKQHVSELAKQLRIDGKELTGLMRSLAQIAFDVDFLEQVLAINENINDLSADN